MGHSAPDARPCPARGFADGLEMKTTPRDLVWAPGAHLSLFCSQVRLPH